VLVLAQAEVPLDPTRLLLLLLLLLLLGVRTALLHLPAYLHQLASALLGRQVLQVLRL
jgi:hypothetical protein